MYRKNRHHLRPLAARLAALAVAAAVAGCAGAPPSEEVPEAAPPAPPTAEEVILDAKVHAQNRQYEQAASKLEEIHEKEKANIEVLRLLAAVYTALGKTEESAEAWKKISILDPTDPDAAYECGSSLARRSDWNGVRTKMLVVESAGAADSRHYLLLGEADMELGYRGEAEKYLKKAKGLGRAQYILGKLYYERGKLAKAERTFEKVLASNPDNYSAHLYMGWLCYKKGERLRALKHYESSTRLNPEDALARLSLAALLEELDRKEEAIGHYRGSLSLPNAPKSERKKAYNSLTRLLVERGRTEEAVSLVRKGLSEFPGAGGLYFQWGEALLKEGRKDEAREKFKRAAEDPVWREVALRRIHTIR